MFLVEWQTTQVREVLRQSKMKHLLTISVLYFAVIIAQRNETEVRDGAKKSEMGTTTLNNSDRNTSTETNATKMSKPDSAPGRGNTTEIMKETRGMRNQSVQNTPASDGSMVRNASVAEEQTQTMKMNRSMSSNLTTTMDSSMTRPTKASLQNDMFTKEPADPERTSNGSDMRMPTQVPKQIKTREEAQTMGVDRMPESNRSLGMTASSTMSSQLFEPTKQMGESMQTLETEVDPDQPLEPTEGKESTTQMDQNMGAGETTEPAHVKLMTETRAPTLNMGTGFVSTTRGSMGSAESPEGTRKMMESTTEGGPGMSSNQTMAMAMMVTTESVQRNNVTRDSVQLDGSTEPEMDSSQTDQQSLRTVAEEAQLVTKSMIPTRQTGDVTQDMQPDMSADLESTTELLRSPGSIKTSVDNTLGMGSAEKFVSTESAIVQTDSARNMTLPEASPSTSRPMKPTMETVLSTKLSEDTQPIDSTTRDDVAMGVTSENIDDEVVTLRSSSSSPLVVRDQTSSSTTPPGKTHQPHLNRTHCTSVREWIVVTRSIESHPLMCDHLSRGE